MLDRACLCFQEDDRVRAACERREADTSAGLRGPALDPDLSLLSAPAPAAASWYESSIYIGTPKHNKLFNYGCAVCSAFMGNTFSSFKHLTVNNFEEGK